MQIPTITTSRLSSLYPKATTFKLGSGTDNPYFHPDKLSPEDFELWQRQGEIMSKSRLKDYPETTEDYKKARDTRLEIRTRWQDNNKQTSD